MKLDIQRCTRRSSFDFHPTKASKAFYYSTPSSPSIKSSVFSTTILTLSLWVVRLWVFKLLLCANAFSQTSQTYGFSPEWIRSCRLMWLGWTKVLPQSRQLYGRSFVWILIWVFKSYRLKKPFPQSLHACGLSFKWSLLTCSWK